jgi:hypothetical protein
VTLALRIEPRFKGPPQSGNGGYTAGLIAVAVNETVKVRLQAVDDERWEVHREHEVVASAVRTQVSLAVPTPVSFIEARAYSTHFIGFKEPLYPTCFVCGPARSERDGLRIFAGRVPDTPTVAAPWIPDETLDDGSGKVRPEFIWAALDCPGFYARSHIAPALLGELAVHIDRPVHVDEPCVIMGWSIRTEGRKHFVGTALFDEDGERCAVGAATWIAVASA